MKNRMLEIGTYGTVRGEGGNILTYSATWPVMAPVCAWARLVNAASIHLK